jgi:S1-C subfamily serine protease
LIRKSGIILMIMLSVIAEPAISRSGLAESTYVKLIESVKERVVRVVVERNGEMQGGEESNYCTGFLISADGFVLTIRHSFLDDSYTRFDFDKITVVMNDGREYRAHPFEVSFGKDLFLLKINPEAEVDYFDIADRDAIKLGRDILTIGYPRQYGSLTVSEGIIRNMNSNRSAFYTSATSYYGGSGSPVMLIDGTLAGILRGVYAYSGRDRSNSDLTYDHGTEATDLTKYGDELKSLMSSLRSNGRTEY